MPQLDSCEHLLAPCAEIVEALLRTCPRLTVLATSREPLEIPGEVQLGVPPLSSPGSGRNRALVVVVHRTHDR